jgi:hypothetical protein
MGQLFMASSRIQNCPKYKNAIVLATYNFIYLFEKQHYVNSFFLTMINCFDINGAA